jgi:hypothetical protein
MLIEQHLDSFPLIWNIKSTLMRLVYTRVPAIDLLR